MKFINDNFSSSMDYTLRNKDLVKLKEAIDDLANIEGVRCVLVDAYADRGCLVNLKLSVAVYDDENSISEANKVLENFVKSDKGPNINYCISCTTTSQLLNDIIDRNLFIRDLSNGYTFIDREDYFNRFSTDRLSSFHLRLTNIEDIDDCYELKNTKNS